MQNKHIEHIEDSILTGDLSAIETLYTPQNVSVKMDGSPAIVWGTNPANGKFFVGTKSVFNKVKIKINHSHGEIDQNHQGKVARILHAAFDCLPRTTSIIQGDFLGFGGSDTYRPNTITYIFPEIIAQDIIVAPHTIYKAKGDLRNAIASPFTSKLISTGECLFVQPEAQLNPHREDIADICKFAKQMSMLCEFVTPAKATKIKKHINDCIRNQNDICEYEIAEKFDCDANVIRLWKLVASIKDDLMYGFIQETDDIVTMIGDEDSNHEGYCISNKYGMFKVVNRHEFSRMNFIMEKTW